MGCYYNQVYTVLLGIIGDGMGRPVRLYGFRLDFDALGSESRDLTFARYFLDLSMNVFLKALIIKRYCMPIFSHI